MKILTLLALLLIATPLHAQEKLTSENIYKIVDQMPQPTVNLSEYLSANIHYPIFARKHNITGKVLVRFVVADDGALQNVEIIKGIGGGCDEEALRVVKGMPKWKPGVQNGKKVAVYYTQPISFLLD